MPGRTTPLATGEYYHVFNRGNEKRNVFTRPRDYKRFIKTLCYYQFAGKKPSFSKFSKSDFDSFKPDPKSKLVEVICYCLMPNHFHLLLKQLKDNGISIFLSQISNSYTKYFNTKYTRVGALLQGVFKAVRIETDEQLVHASRYIHLNPVVAGIVKGPDIYFWSSYHEYIAGNDMTCSIDEILGFFSSSEKYQEFVKNQIDYATTLETLKHRTMDIDD